MMIIAALNLSLVGVIYISQIPTLNKILNYSTLKFLTL